MCSVFHALGFEKVDLKAVDELLAKAKTVRVDVEQGNTRTSKKVKTSKTTEPKKGRLQFHDK